MSLKNLDNPILPGAAARTLLISDDGTLPYVDTSGSEPLAVAETVDAGELLCTAGTVVWNDDLTMVAQLGLDGWAAVRGTLPDIDEAPADESEEADGNE